MAMHATHDCDQRMGNGSLPGGSTATAPSHRHLAAAEATTDRAWWGLR